MLPRAFGAYLAGFAGLVAVALSLGLASVRLRARLLPGWEGAPARLVESVIGLSLLTILLQLLGAIGLFEPAVIVGASIAIAAGVAAKLPRRRGRRRAGPGPAAPRDPGPPPRHRPRRRRVPRRPLGDRAPGRVGPGDAHLRHALVPRAVRGADRRDRLGLGPALHRPALPELVLPAGLRAPPRGGHLAVRPRHPLSLRQLRLARASACSRRGASAAPTASPR